jgi:gas vesicle protein
LAPTGILEVCFVKLHLPNFEGTTKTLRKVVMTDYERFGEYETKNGGGAPIGTALALLFVGLGIGAITALLLSPKSGRQMRRTIRRKYEDACDRFDDWSDQAGDVVGRGTKWAKDARERITPLKKRFAE